MSKPSTSCWSRLRRLSLSPAFGSDRAPISTIHQSTKVIIILQGTNIYYLVVYTGTFGCLNLGTCQVRISTFGHLNLGARQSLQRNLGHSSLGALQRCYNHERNKDWNKNSKRNSPRHKVKRICEITGGLIFNHRAHSTQRPNMEEAQKALEGPWSLAWIEDAIVP